MQRVTLRLCFMRRVKFIITPSPEDEIMLLFVALQSAIEVPVCPNQSKTMARSQRVRSGQEGDSLRNRKNCDAFKCHSLSQCFGGFSCQRYILMAFGA